MPERKYNSADPGISRMFQRRAAQRLPGAPDRAVLLMECIEECDPELEAPFQYNPPETKDKSTSDN
jgi:hypothetical protein